MAMQSAETKRQRKARQANEYKQFMSELRAFGTIEVDDNGFARCGDPLCRKIFSNALPAASFPSASVPMFVGPVKRFLDHYSSKVKPRGIHWECLTCGKCVDIFDVDGHVVWEAHKKTKSHVASTWAEKRLTLPIEFVEGSQKMEGAEVMTYGKDFV